MYSQRNGPSRTRPRWFVFVPLAGLSLLALGIVIGVAMAGKLGPLVSPSGSRADVGRLGGVGAVEEVLRYVDAKYVDEVDKDALAEAAIAAVLDELDPFSSYVSEADLLEHREQIEGVTTGLGLDIAMIRDSATVLAVVPGSAAAEAGMLPYDRVLSIDSTVVSGVGLGPTTLEQLVADKGEESIRLRLARRGVPEVLRLTLSRKPVSIPTVDPGVLIDGDVAYIRVRQFAGNTYQEFMGQLERLTQQEGARHLVLDLRGNSGGYLQEAVSLLSQLFLEDGKLLVYTDGEHSPRREYKTTGRVFFPVDRVSVLIDRGSASASEIVAAAVQDWDRGEVVGEPSFGKGMVQELYSLSEGGALHLTVSRYYTPSGRSIQRDFELAGHGYGIASGSPVDTTAEAFTTAGGRIVYGAGGVRPDRVITSDDAFDEPRFSALRQAYEGFIADRWESISSQDDERRLLSDFLADDRISSLIGPADPAAASANGEALRRWLKYDVTRATAGETEATRLRLARDPVVAAALEGIRDRRPIARR